MRLLVFASNEPGRRQRRSSLRPNVGSRVRKPGPKQTKLQIDAGDGNISRSCGFQRVWQLRILNTINGRKKDKLELTDNSFNKLFWTETMLEETVKNQGSSSESELYVSDRRWKKAVKLLSECIPSRRDSVNPLDIMLLQDCLWHSPESRDVVRSVVKDFALNRAFDQQESKSQIEMSREELEEIQDDVESTLSVSLSWSQPVAYCVKTFTKMISRTRKCTASAVHTTCVKLVMPQSNMSVSESEKGDSRWVYVAMMILTVH